MRWAYECDGKIMDRPRAPEPSFYHRKAQVMRLFLVEVRHLQRSQLQLPREAGDCADFLEQLVAYAFLSSPLLDEQTIDRLLEVNSWRLRLLNFAIVCDNPVGLKLPSLKPWGFYWSPEFRC